MPLTLLRKLGYGVGHVLNDLCAAMWFTYFLLFYEYVLGFSSVHSGSVLLTGQIADALSTPFVGILSDRGCTNTRICKKYGQRKLWHLGGTIFVLLSVPFIYSGCIDCNESSVIIRLVYYSIFVCIFQFGWAAVQISHLALVPDLTSSDSERTQLLSIRNSFTVLSNLTVYVLAWIMLQVAGGDEDDSQLSNADIYKFRDVTIIVCVIGAIMTIIFHLTTKLDNDLPLLDSENETSRRLSLKEIFAQLKLYEVAMIYMASRLVSNLSQSMVPLYLQDTLQLPKQNLAIIPLVMYVTSFLTSLITGPMNSFCGRQITYGIGSLLSIIASLWIFFDNSDLFKTYFLYIVAALFGSSSSILLVTSLSITADLIGNNIQNSAFIYGIMSFTDKLSSGAAIYIIQYLKPLKSHSAYYRYVIPYSCGSSAFVGIIVVILVFTFKKCEQNSKRNTRSNENSENI